jgi:hypothetical protein
MLFQKLIFFFVVTDAFDSEYRETYKTMVQSDAKELMKMSDKPPNNIAVWCRRLFSPLLV